MSADATPEQFNAYLEKLVAANPNVPRGVIGDLFAEWADTGMEVRDGFVHFPNGKRLRAPDHEV